MNAAKATGLNVESTRPLSRAERRAAAARVHPEQHPAGGGTPASGSEADAQHSPPVAPPPPPIEPAQIPTPQSDEASPPIALKPREKPGKRPFATQLRPSTLARLEWVKARGYAITDTVDAAINQYLDAVGIPPADENH